MTIISAFTIENNEASQKAISETLVRSRDPRWASINTQIEVFHNYSVDGSSLVIISTQKFMELPSPLWIAGALIVILYFWLGITVWMLAALFFVFLAMVQSSHWLYYGFGMTLKKAGYKGKQKRVALEDALRWVCFGRT